MLSKANELRRLGFDKVHRKLVNYDLDISPRHLYECYKKPSVAKWDAYNDCLTFCQSLNGLFFTVSSYSPMVFTVEFIFKYLGVWYFARITKSHKHVFPIQNALEIQSRYGFVLR